MSHRLAQGGEELDKSRFPRVTEESSEVHNEAQVSNTSISLKFNNA